MFLYRTIDLTHALKSSAPHWSGKIGFELQTELNYEECEPDVKFRVQKLQMYAGMGTHIDAPSHCIEGGKTIEEMHSFIAPCIVIDVSAEEEEIKISEANVRAFEKQYGKIQKNTFVIFYTGWEQYWDHPDKYINDYKFPSLSLECANFLLQREIVGIGIDTLSPDYPDDKFCVHKAILGAGKYIVENVKNSKLLPAFGSFIGIFPLKIEGGTEAPVRLIGFIS